MTTKRKGKVENLRPVTSKEEARRRGKVGGVASGVARKEKKILTEIILRKLAEKSASGQTRGEDIIDAMLQQAQKGNVKAFTALSDRAEGKPIQQVQVEGNVAVAQALLAARKRTDGE